MKDKGHSFNGTVALLASSLQYASLGNI